MEAIANIALIPVLAIRPYVSEFSTDNVLRVMQVTKDASENERKNDINSIIL
ncbi:hypothetical protein IYZ83_005865 [Wolbachia pipientis]|uniref:hypothetical protein n=1 Tax=Wolbachia pipientis TaxID=955 RepID=UPI001BDAA98C|nr:hypothetical protein [Wolbachia pipientis]UIP91639.1 hypothetical protein IYZ83_005865 [Wolbachia pipientis]